MTECERLIANGTFTRDFFKPEVRCDFLVDEKRKKIWAIELDLLLQFDKVCKENGLRYFLDGGTLLGAIRHNGFIPWDDDVDVAMPRADYDKLTGLAHLFKSPYTLQIPGVDGYGFSFVKIRNRMTTAASDMFLYAPFNQGLCLDVFPLDNAKIEESRFSYNTTKEYSFDNSSCMRKSNPHLDDANKRRVLECKHANINDNLRLIDAACRYYNSTSCDHLGILACAITAYEHHIFKKESYKTATYHAFEGYNLPVPVGYEEVLTVQYGDYMEFPPVEKRGTWHTGATLEPDIAYEDYRASRIKELSDKQ